MFRMQEEEYFQTPFGIREKHLASKNLTPELSDFNELMKDENYVKLQKVYKKAKAELEHYQYHLRGKLRNEKLNNAWIQHISATLTPA